MTTVVCIINYKVCNKVYKKALYYHACKHCIMYNALFHWEQCILCTLYNIHRVNSVVCSVFLVKCVVACDVCVLYSCTVSPVCDEQSSLCTLQNVYYMCVTMFTVYTVQCSLCVLYSEHCVRCTVCTIYTVRCTLSTMHIVSSKKFLRISSSPH